MLVTFFFFSSNVASREPHNAHKEISLTECVVPFKFTSQLKVLQTLIWYPLMSAEDFCSKTFFSPEGLQRNETQNTRDVDFHSYEKETVAN